MCSYSREQSDSIQVKYTNTKNQKSSPEHISWRNCPQVWPLMENGHKNMVDTNYGILKGSEKQQTRCKCNLNSS